MISETFPSLRPKPVYQYGPQGALVNGKWVSRYTRAGALKITEAEFDRRDEIVKGLYAECAYYVGKTYFPHSEAKKKEYGACTVRELYRNYYEFPLNEEWPKDDHPFLVTIQSEKMEGLILCTETWLNPKECNTCS